MCSALHLLKTTNINGRASRRKERGWNWEQPPRPITKYLKQFLME